MESYLITISNKRIAFFYSQCCHYHENYTIKFCIILMQHIAKQVTNFTKLLSCLYSIFVSYTSIPTSRRIGIKIFALRDAFNRRSTLHCHARPNLQITQHIRDVFEIQRDFFFTPRRAVAQFQLSSLYSVPGTETQPETFCPGAAVKPP